MERTPRFSISRARWLVVALGLCAYANSFTAEFVFDNRLVILQDTRLAACRWENIVAIFRENYWWPTFATDLYRPLTTLTYFLNRAVLGSGADPLWYHVGNVALHLANACLLLSAVLMLGRRMVPAVCAAIVFVVHPVNVEAVTNLVGRADLLATFFLLLALHARLRERRWLLLVSSAAAILSKENGIMVVPFILLFDVMMVRDRNARNRALVADGLALLPVLVAFGVLRARFSAGPVVVQSFLDNPLLGTSEFVRIMTAARVQGFYCGLLAWPRVLSCDYSYDQIPLYGTGGPWESVLAWLSVAGILAASAWAVFGGPRHRLGRFSVLLFFTLSLPTANILHVIGSIAAERFLYLPMIGGAVLIGLVLERAGSALARVARDRRMISVGSRVAPLAMVCIPLMLRTRVRNRDWRDDLSLWRSAVKAAPHSAKTHKGLAEVLFLRDPTERGIDAALVELEAAQDIMDQAYRPGHPERGDSTVLVVLGRYYSIKADFCHARKDDATARRFRMRSIATLREATRFEVWANQENRRLELLAGKRPEEIREVGRPEAHRVLALDLLKAGRPAEALVSAERLVQLAPSDATAWHLEADCLRAAARPDDAIVCDLAALLSDFDYVPAWEQLRALYRLLVPNAKAVVAGSSHQYQIDARNPRVHRDLAKASTAVYRTLSEVNDHAAAALFATFVRRRWNLTMPERPRVSGVPR